MDVNGEGRLSQMATTWVDRPEAYIPGDRRRAIALGVSLPDRVHGAALFADISGFTPLTEALADELGSQRASEVLTGHLNRVFHAVIAELDRYGGEVIYFSGDAITCWLDGDDGSRATASALAMQEAMAREGEVTTPGGISLMLALKVAVAVGQARRFVVGDPEIQLVDVLAGSLVDRLADAEHLAEKGEVVLDGSAVESLRAVVRLGESRTDEESGSSVAVATGLLTEVAETPPTPGGESLDADLARPWLLPAVFERLSTGRGEFLAELRPAYPVFVNFTGIDYDTDEAASEQLDLFVRAAQRVLSSYGGNVLQLTLGDKGAYLYGAFGTPLAHEDDAARACAAALELRGLETTTAAREIRIGITFGRLRSGTYGHEDRRTFVCLGDAVNLSARLMSKAPPGGIYVSELVRRAAGASFAWTKLEPLQLKGKSASVSAYALNASNRRHSRRVIRYRLPLVGRAAELAQLTASRDTAAAGHGRIVGISAEAGMGKSRLVAEFVRDSRRAGLNVAMGECQSFGTGTSYFVWREIWRTLFGIGEHAPADEQARALEEALGAVDPDLVPRAPLLDAMFGLSIPDTDLTRAFDAKLRKTSLENLLADYLRARALIEPQVLVLEDCHWLDPLSRDLLEVVARAVSSSQVLLVLAYRPEAASPQTLGLAQLPQIEELPLSALDEENMADLVGSKLEQLFGEDETGSSEFLVDLVVGRAQGNPFYAEELLNYVQEQEIDPSDEKALRSLELPGSLHSLVLSRIDTLSESPRRTLKIASVVGRVFRAPMLPGVYPELGTIGDVRAHLGTLGLLDLVNPDREEDESYLFKHAVTQEVAYESIPYALRVDLHGKVGRFIEGHEPDAVERNLDVLAHHYGHSADLPKKREYLVRAGVAAQANFANAAAIDYFERAAPLLEGADRWQIMRRLGEVLEVAGEWPRGEAVHREALLLATELQDDDAAAWTETSLADLARKRGEYDDALAWLDAATARFDALGDQPGLGRVLQIKGTVAATRGDFTVARELLEASLDIRRELGDKAAMGALLSNLGIMAEYDGDFDRCRRLHEEALSLRSEAGDKSAVAISLMNLGNVLLLQGHVEDARHRQVESLRLRRETGDPWMIALGEHNLGLLTRAQGDYDTTRRLFASALKTFHSHGDKWALPFMLEDVAVLAALTDGPEIALRLAGAGATLRDETGAPRGTADQAELDAQLAAARETLAGRADEAWHAGRGLELDAAVKEAQAVLASPGR